MPSRSQIDEKHPLVAGVSNNLISAELSMPVDDPSIVVDVIVSRKQDPSYIFKLKDSGVDRETLENMIHLLLI